MSSLLAQADQLLTGAAGARSHSLRAACWLARAALEDTVRALLEAKQLDPGTASMSVALSCLHAAYQGSEPLIPLHADVAWSGLSRASHHHAYELSPTISEVRHLLQLVAGLAAHPSGSGTPD